MPKFIIALLTMLENFYVNHLCTYKETRQDRKRREAREKRAKAKAEKAELEAKKLEQEKLARKEAYELRKLEWHWVSKIMNHLFTLKGNLPIKRLTKFEHMYRVEIIPLRTFCKERTFLYAYVECRDCKGATILLYDPKKEGNQYTAVYHHSHNEYIKIDKPGKDTKVSVLERAERIFQPLREELALAAA